MVYKRLAEEWGVPASWEECETYGRSVGNWPAFPDSAEALQYLKQHYKLAILSNVDNESFALSNRRLQVTFDAILTAEDIGSYKPDDRNFRYMLEKLGGMGIAKEQILHTAESLFHDHEPANRAGLTSCWIYRRHGDTGFGATMAPSVTPKYQFRFTSMMEMGEAHQEELAQRWSALGTPSAPACKGLTRLLREPLERMAARPDRLPEAAGTDRQRPRQQRTPPAPGRSLPIDASDPAGCRKFRRAAPQALKSG